MPIADSQIQDVTARETATGVPVTADEQAALGTPGGASGASDAARATPVVPEQSRGTWTTSFDPADFPVPKGREEAWRFTPLDRLHAVLADGEPAEAVPVEWDLPAGVTAAELTGEDARALGISAPADRAAAVAFARSGRTRHLDVPADTELDAPVVVRQGWGDRRAEHATFGHLAITVGRHARATVVLEHAGPAEHNELVSVVAGDGADVTLVSLQEWDGDAVHLAEHDVVVGRDARVRHIAITLGGSVVRIGANAAYTGPGGTFEGLGVYFADAGQHLEHRLFVDHSAPRCTSDVLYKGALQGATAHTVWVGDVLIRAAAEGTDTYELNRNLLLTEGARADSVPNLEIETGEIVGAGHASATGRFDDEQLFYLRSRGIPPAEARRLVVRGFFADIIGRIGLPAVSERLMAAIEAELELSMGASTFSAEAVEAGGADR